MFIQSKHEDEAGRFVTSYLQIIHSSNAFVHSTNNSKVTDKYL